MLGITLLNSPTMFTEGEALSQSSLVRILLLGS